VRTLNSNDPLTAQAVESREELAQELFDRQAVEVSAQTLSILQRDLSVNNQVVKPPERVARRLVRHHHRTMRLVSEHDLPIRFVGFWRIPESFEVLKGPDCDWVLQSVPDDPLYQHRNNHLPVPEAVRTEIGRMNEAGVDFPATFIAHAVPTGSMKDKMEVEFHQVVPLPDREVTARLNALNKGVTFLRRGTEAVIKATAVAGAAVSAGAIAVPAALAAALPLVAATPLVVLDPILFGVEVVDGWQTEDGQPIGSWYYLTHWYWPVLKEEK
jgi:hypothetical protein